MVRVFPSRSGSDSNSLKSRLQLGSDSFYGAGHELILSMIAESGPCVFAQKGGLTQSRCMWRLKSRFFRGRISAMEGRSRSRKLAPTGFVVEHAEIDTDCVFLDVRATAVSATCPCCGTSSLRTQSRYLRQAADLPIAGRRVFLRVRVRRF